MCSPPGRGGEAGGAAGRAWDAEGVSMAAHSRRPQVRWPRRVERESNGAPRPAGRGGYCATTTGSIASRTVALRAPPPSFTTRTFANPRQVRGRRPTLRLMPPVDDVSGASPKGEWRKCPGANGVCGGPGAQRLSDCRHIRRSVGRRGGRAAAPERRWTGSSSSAASRHGRRLRSGARARPDTKVHSPPARLCARSLP